MDLYTVLGLTRAASGADIDRAYRRLARRYHPGVNPGDRVAEDLYRQIQDAHRILSDDDRRRDYDRGGGAPEPQADVRVAFEGFDFSSPVEGSLAATFSELFSDVFQEAAREAVSPTRGADLDLTARVSFADAARGARVPVSVTRGERCPMCAGVGHVSRSPVQCPICNGQGTRRWARGHMVFTKACELCDGAGSVTTVPCRPCGGFGVTPRTEVVTLTLPAGFDPGARLVVPGHGHAGARGGPAGDLLVTVEVADHPFFRRVGRDLHVVVPISVSEAGLGATVQVPTLDGAVFVDVPVGTASGTQVRLRGHGLTVAGSPQTAGDLVAEIQIVVPVDLDDRSKELLREFAQRNDGDVRRGLFARG